MNGATTTARRFPPPIGPVLSADEPLSLTFWARGWFWFLFLFAMVAAASPHLRELGPTELLRYALLAVGCYWLAIRWFARSLPLQLQPLHLSILLFCLWAISTASYSTQVNLTLVKGLAFLCLVVFCFLYAGQIAGSVREVTVRFFWCIVGLNVIAVPASILFNRAGLEMTRFKEYGVRALGMYGVFGNPNTLGTFTAFSLPVILWAMSSKRAWRYPLGLLLAMNVYCLLASLSRAGLGAALLGVGLYLAVRRPKLLLLYVYLGGMVALLALAYAPEELSLASQTYVFKARQAVFSSRVEHWKTSASYIQERWLLGYGLGASPGVGQEWDWSFSSWQVLRVRGSSLLAVWEETGLVGLSLIVVPIAILMTRALRYLQAAKQPGSEAFQRIAALTSFLLVGCVNMLTEEWLLSPGYFGNVFFWMAFFLLARHLYVEARRSDQTRSAPMAFAPRQV